ncbi:MAG: winged helix-turn-helix domain-containing protein, partial [Devosia sp.]|nr:winged helix-turn-helix domain-containing protein [Devosia sp.]
MQMHFGPFVLDEEARALMLRGEAQHVQPRVFDLIAYLVRNAGRVVPKDELLDALWPNVTVTESSLQRAASL